VSGDRRILRQHVRQRPARGQGTLAGFFDRAVGGLLAHRHGQSHGDRFRHDEAAGQLEVRAHARRIDHEAVEAVGHRACRARGEEDQLRQRLPFRGPAPETALVLLGHGHEERGDQAGRADRRRQRDRRPDRVALVRHGRRSAAPRRGASCASSTSVWARSETSRAILPRVPTATPSVPARCARRSRWACHGRSGTGRSAARPGPARPPALRGPAPPACRKRLRAGGRERPRGRPRCGRARARAHPANPPPSSRRSRESLAGATSGRPSASARGAPRARTRPAPRGPGGAGPRARRLGAAARARCRGRPGWSRPNARSAPTPDRSRPRAR
jgi:hypothetical protein